MKRLILEYLQIFLSLLLTISTSGQDTGIIFKPLLINSALELAKKENKVVFMDCYATWCGPCKMLSKNVFTRKEVGDYFNQHFICLKFDMEGDGKDIRRKYEISAYPTLLFLDFEGKVLEKIVGYREPDVIVKVAKKANDPEKNMQALNLQFEKGAVNYDVIENQIRNSKFDITKEALLDKYFNSISSAEWTNKESWDLITKYVPITSSYFNYLLVNEQMYGSLYGKKAVESVILNKFRMYYQQKKTTEDKLQATAYLKTFKHPLAVKGVLIAENAKSFSDILNDPAEKDFWGTYFLTLQKLNDGFGENVKPWLRKQASELIRRKINVPKASKSIIATKHPLATTMVQYLQLYVAREILQDNMLSQKETGIVLTVANEISSERLIEHLDVNNLAWQMLLHKNREKFLTMAQKLSFLTLEEKKCYYYGTYGAICAQMNNFEEAIKHAEMALQLAKNDQPDKVQYYIDIIEKFKNKQSLY